MLTQGFDYMQYYEIHHQALVQEAQQYRQVKEALKARPPQTRPSAKILAAVGGTLVSLGSSLEELDPSAPQIKILQHSPDKGC